MTRKQKHYSKQFKIDAVKLITEQGYKVSEAAHNRGVGKPSLKKIAPTPFQVKGI